MAKLFSLNENEDGAAELPVTEDHYQEREPQLPDLEKNMSVFSKESANQDKDDDNNDIDDNDNDNDEFWFDPVIRDNEFQYHVLRKVMWDDTDHWKVMTQLYGSVWPKVFPLCMLNVVWTCIIWYFKQMRHMDFTVNKSGHAYTATLMSFLLVSRLHILYGRYMENSKNLTTMLKSCREMIANLCVLTARETGKRAKQWRQDVTYSMLILLRVSVAALQFRSNPDENPWTLPEVLQEHGQDRHEFSFDSSTPKDKVHLEREKRSGPNKQPKKQPPPIDSLAPPPPPPPRPAAAARSQHRRQVTSDMTSTDPFVASSSIKSTLAHIPDDQRKETEEVARATELLALNVKLQVMRQRDGTVFRMPRAQVFDHPCNEETRLLDLVSDYLKSFGNLFKNLTTPIPFPLVQMTKMFLYVWIFTVPLAIVHERYNHSNVDHPIIPMLIVFIITFGFLGLDFVSVELTDNFGFDATDFDALGMSQIAMEDCYMAIYHQDGKAWAHALRKRFLPKKDVPGSNLFL